MISAKFSGKVSDASISVLVIHLRTLTIGPTSSLLEEVEETSFVCAVRSLFNISTELISKTENNFDNFFARFIKIWICSILSYTQAINSF